VCSKKQHIPEANNVGCSKIKVQISVLPYLLKYFDDNCVSLVHDLLSFIGIVTCSGQFESKMGT